ncbi:hypothetical protein Leryth_016722 [Lithospermum erythrorhizon]|nr:hypothetical protein Leryth_016722 [Lithospermum erythrorhizon]
MNNNLIDAKLEEHQLSTQQCPGCGHKVEGKLDWVGLPAGVKFDPTDQELIEHLEAKVLEGSGNNNKQSIKSHPLIDEFIPTIEGEDGICYTHPEKLPGVTRDGLSRHFFHRPSKAYTTGTRKRRKIQTELTDQLTASASTNNASSGGETRWHKTGKTRPVLVNGKQKGCKKILVLYTNFGKNRKPEKTNWVMHQYHLGQHEEEKEGELVVSKIFYQTQPRQCNWSAERLLSPSTSQAVQAPAEGGTALMMNTPTGEGSTSSLHETNTNNSRRDNAGSGSSSSNNEIMNPHRDNELSMVAGAAAIPSYSTNLEIQQLKTDAFGFVPFRKTFGEAGIGEGSHQTGTCEEGDMRTTTTHHVTHQHHHYLQHHPSTAFHVSRPSHPTPTPLHHHTSLVLHEDVLHTQRIMLQNQNFQQQQQQQHHHKMGGRSATGLEEVIMGCTSSTANAKEESAIQTNQETEWLKYSTFWPDSNNPDHHG